MSKKKGRIKALAGMILLFWLFSGSVGNDQVLNGPDDRYAIKLRSRHFIPEAGLPASLAAIGAEPGLARSHLLAQFDEIPDKTARDALEGLGVRLLDYIPNRSWFVSIPSNFPWLASPCGERAGPAPFCPTTSSMLP